MTAQALYETLSNPEKILTARALAERFTHKIIEVQLQGLGALISTPNLLVKVRGAMGQVMLEGASDAVRGQMRCNWSPCCASEVFFADKPSVDLGRRQFQGNQELKPQIIKPFVLSAERAGQQNLLIRMTIFGFAQDWAPMAHQALVSALRYRVRWQALSNDQFFIPARVEIISTRVRDRSIRLPESTPDQCTLSFTSPLDTERTGILDNPSRLLQRLAIRVALAARWYGVQLSDELPEAIDGQLPWQVEYFGPVHTDSVRIDSGRSGESGFRKVSMLDARVSGNLTKLWPLLCIGEKLHVGRGAVKGYGRYTLQTS